MGFKEVSLGFRGVSIGFRGGFRSFRGGFSEDSMGFRGGFREGFRGSHTQASLMSRGAILSAIVSLIVVPDSKQNHIRGPRDWRLST